MTDRARAVQVCQEFVRSSGGTTTSVIQFQAALGGSIVAFGDRLEGAGRIPIVNVSPADGVRGRLYGWAAPPALVAAARVVASADLVVCHMLYQYHIQWGARSARANHSPYWVVPHGSLDPYVLTYRSARKRLWLAALGSRILGQATRVIFATERERQKAESVIGYLPNASVLRWPVDQISLADRVSRREQKRTALGISASQRLLLYVGRLHSMKRPLETISLIGPLAERGVVLVVVGPDGDVTRAECEALCERHGWTNVRITGAAYGSERDDYYAAADAFVSFSQRENFGHSVAEALACGLPVMLGPGIDLSADLAATSCGWLLPEVTQDAVSRAVTEFARVPADSLASMGAQGRAWARRELSPEHFVRSILAMAEDDVGR